MAELISGHNFRSVDFGSKAQVFFVVERIPRVPEGIEARGFRFHIGFFGLNVRIYW